MFGRPSSPFNAATLRTQSASRASPFFGLFPLRPFLSPQGNVLFPSVFVLQWTRHSTPSLQVKKESPMALGTGSQPVAPGEGFPSWLMILFHAQVFFLKGPQNPTLNLFLKAGRCQAP